MLTPHIPVHNPIPIRMSSKGQIVIPRAAREVHGVGEGTPMDLVIEADGYRIVPRRRTMEEFLAFAAQMRAKYKIKPMTQKEMDQAIMDHVAELDERTKTKPRKRKRK